MSLDELRFALRQYVSFKLDSELVSHGTSGRRIVARDHDDLQPSRLQLANRLWVDSFMGSETPTRPAALPSTAISMTV